MATYSDFATYELPAESAPTVMVHDKPAVCLAPNGIDRVGQRRQPLSECTPAQWDALEARAVACMRAQLVRYHLGGGMEQAADWERAKNSWALIVMNRERLTSGGKS